MTTEDKITMDGLKPSLSTSPLSAGVICLKMGS